MRAEEIRALATEIEKLAAWAVLARGAAEMVKAAIAHCRRPKKGQAVTTQRLISLLGGETGGRPPASSNSTDYRPTPRQVPHATGLPVPACGRCGFWDGQSTTHEFLKPAFA
jgi:hypothetical protein